MFKLLFDENGRYTEEALKLDADVVNLLEQFFKLGYSPRDVYTLISLSVAECMYTAVLDWKRPEQ